VENVSILKENSMKPSNQDRNEGTFHTVKGSVKEIAGKLSDNPKLEAEGTIEKISGNIQQKIGQIKKVLGK
jgi:uncharacterized protein YjbJ (UPF0337 family)